MSRNAAQAEQYVSPAALPENVFYETNGNAHMAKQHLKKAFGEELRNFLAYAGFPGHYTVTVASTTVKASSFTKGLRIGSHKTAPPSVELYWHDPDKGNDGRVPFLLSTPTGMDPHRFHGRLREALQRYHEDKQLGIELFPRVVEPSIQPIKPTEKGMPSAPTPPPGQNGAEPPPPQEGGQDAGEQAATDNSRQKFVKDAEKVELLYLHLLPHADDHGVISRKMCSQILQEDFKVLPNGTGSLMRSLKVSRILFEAPNDNLRIPKVKLRHLRSGTAPQPDGAAPPKPKRMPKSSPLAARLDDLEELAKSLPSLEQELADLDNETRKLAERRPKLETKIANAREAATAVEKVKNALAQMEKEK